LKIVIASRAMIYLVTGLLITFTQSHSANTGLMFLAGFGIGLALVNSISTLIAKSGIWSLDSLPVSLVAALVGLAASFIPSSNQAASGLAFVYLVAGWALISGSFDLYLARRVGFKSRSGKDSLISSALSLLLGVLFLAAPIDIVSAVGFFGAYLVLTGVHLAIAAFTPEK
jgi:uncharacterized membrane protein HdeD (DUF308 family)